MPLDLGNHPTRPVPTDGLIFEISKPNDGLSGWTTHRSGQQVFDLFLKHLVGGKPDGIQKALLLQVFINLWLGEGGVTTKVFADCCPRRTASGSQIDPSCWRWRHSYRRSSFR